MNKLFRVNNKVGFLDSILIDGMILYLKEDFPINKENFTIQGLPLGAHELDIRVRTNHGVERYCNKFFGTGCDLTGFGLIEVPNTKLSRVLYG